MKIENIDDLFEFENGEIVKEGILNSGQRIRRSFENLFSGYGLKAEDLLNETLKVKEYQGIVIVRDISFYTYCEHHFAPFYGYADVAYQPNNIITGLGKINRLVRDLHARKMQIQEVMCKDIVDDIVRVLNAKGVHVRLKAKHMCICSRGPSDDTSWTETCYAVGTLKEKSFDSLLDSDHIFSKR